MEILLINGLIFILGLGVGSFVNMLVYRVAIKYELEVYSVKRKRNKNRSFCDFCGRQLRWKENIPVLSWIRQKGKSGCCQKKLPIFYPIVEAGTGIVFWWFNFRYPYWQTDWWLWGLGLIILTLMIFLTVFDYRYMILPDFGVIILIILAIVGVVFSEKSLVPYLISSLSASGLLLFLNLITKGKGMGWGDVKLAVFMGLFLGYPGILMAMYLAFIIGALVSLGLIITKKATKKSLIPFGPFLILGTWLSWWFGAEMWQLIWG